uniref:AtC3H23-like CCCH zinc finger domain-containing protein n=1 Tax=Ananas comosus var. bracteatus TaxID=296719 RepID=A0A6V7Q2N8_ANACO|nr:unnamed protein product [Ananas comosus var. bracteatus]
MVPLHLLIKSPSPSHSPSPSPPWSGNASAKPSSSPLTPKKEYPPDLTLPDIKNGIYSTDEFLMYAFKVKPCSRVYSHDWTECPFVHPGENARRRDSCKFLYSCVPCPEFRKGSCSHDDACETRPAGTASAARGRLVDVRLLRGDGDGDGDGEGGVGMHRPTSSSTDPDFPCASARPRHLQAAACTGPVRAAAPPELRGRAQQSSARGRRRRGRASPPLLPPPPPRRRWSCAGAGIGEAGGWGLGGDDDDDDDKEEEDTRASPASWAAAAVVVGFVAAWEEAGAVVAGLGWGWASSRRRLSSWGASGEGREESGGGGGEGGGRGSEEARERRRCSRTTTRAGLQGWMTSRTLWISCGIDTAGVALLRRSRMISSTHANAAPSSAPPRPATASFAAAAPPPPPPRSRSAGNSGRAPRGRRTSTRRPRAGARCPGWPGAS